MDVWVVFGFWHKQSNLVLTWLCRYQTNWVEMEAHIATIPPVIPRKCLLRETQLRESLDTFFLNTTRVYLNSFP